MTAIIKHGKSEIKPDWQAVKLDVTKLYNIEEKDKPFIKSINDVFMYDKNTHTFCCEATPSYFLIHLYTFVEFNEEDLLGPANKVVERDGIEQRYCYEHTDDCYMHAHEVDNLPGRDKTNYSKTFEDEEDAREYMQGNYPF